MEKRGQVTTFIIVGVVAVIAILVVFFLRDTLFETIAGADRVNSYLQGQMDSISKQVKKCVDENVKNDLNILGKQGGFFKPSAYLNYYGNKISFLCMDIPDDARCRNTMLTEEKIEEQLNERLKADLGSCIDLEGFSIAKLYDYELIYSMNSLDVVSEVNMKNVLVNVSLPVKLKRNEFEISENNFINSVDVPMGEVLGVVNGIVSSEAITGNFVLNIFDLSNKPLYVLRRYYSGTNKIYLLKVIEGEYIFNFAIENKK